MTAIDDGHKTSVMPIGILPMMLAVASAFLVLCFILGDQVATIKSQSVEIDAQRKVILDMSQTFRPNSYKFATGFLAGCGDPCIIRGNPGGGVVDYEWLASIVNFRSHIVLIDGYCASACALFADRARANIRITDRATFQFHQTSDGSDPPHSRDIAAWVIAHGGFPSQESGQLTEMDFDEARRFWQPAYSWQRLPFDLDAPTRWVEAYPWVVAGLRGTIQ